MSDMPDSASVRHAFFFLRLCCERAEGGGVVKGCRVSKQRVKWSLGALLRSYYMLCLELS